jgi:formylglycine-generating enzyme
MTPLPVQDPALLDREPPEYPPPWASAWGDDRFGLWADLHVKDVVQRLRWIEPGEFLMGSLDDEPGRYDDEGPQHRVHLTSGFWLADSACTQALWLAVLGGKNPSSFTDDPNNPVEQVDWDDARRFLHALQKDWTEGRAAELPTEAEWEYACRAGTETAFSFGKAITTTQANFSGKLRYDDKTATLGAARGNTVPVKTLPPNAWGLYEMHGNVWEWCADGAQRNYREVAKGQVAENPIQPSEQGPEAHRVMRGGSWLNGAWYLRAASRDAHRRGSRSHHLGFRLALRSSSTSREPGLQAPEASGVWEGPDGPSQGLGSAPSRR